MSNVKKIFRYGTVTAVSYLALLLGTWMLVELISFSPIVAYPIALTIVYVGVYFASATYVFRVSDARKESTRFLLAVVVFWLLNAGFYYVLVDTLQVQYLLSVIVNILIFGPLRYFVYQRFVFITKQTNSN